AKNGAGRTELAHSRVSRGVVREVRAHCQRTKAEARRVISDAANGKGGLGGFVEGQLDVITIQQIDAVEGRLLSGCRDLRDDAVVLVHQTGANGLRGRIGNRGGRASERRSTG